MTDRELLELAAKAAGMSDVKWSDSIEYGPCLWSQRLFDETGSGYWLPLGDDGDALRLAIKLALVINQGHGGESAVFVFGGENALVHALEPYRDDPRAATRRAIVRAAAEIGKAMP